MSPLVWEGLEAKFARHAVLRAQPVEVAEVEAAARTLGVKFDPDYIESSAGTAAQWSVPIQSMAFARRK